LVTEAFRMTLKLVDISAARSLTLSVFVNSDTSITPSAARYRSYR
jgi:hypothetical protein